MPFANPLLVKATYKSIIQSIKEKAIDRSSKPSTDWWQQTPFVIGSLWILHGELHPLTRELPQIQKHSVAS